MCPHIPIFATSDKQFRLCWFWTMLNFTKHINVCPTWQSSCNMPAVCVNQLSGWNAFLRICHCKPKILFSWFLVKEKEEGKKKKLMVVHRGLQNFEKVANLGKLHSFSAPYSNGRLNAMVTLVLPSCEVLCKTMVSFLDHYELRHLSAADTFSLIIAAIT